jgi:LacI family sucrose operon transcriptional repressor
MATIRDVANKAGVAVCTVSRVLNGNESVAPETRQKIMTAIDELDYIPNELARGMFRQKSGIIAMLTPSIRHTFFGNLAHFIERELYVRDYKLMLCSSDDKVEREREYMKMFRSNLVDGVIMCVTNLEDEVYENFKKPMIMVDYRVADIPVVVCDNDQGGALAAEVFIRAERKMILHIHGETEKNVLSLVRHDRLDKDLKAAGINSRRIALRWNEFDFDGYQEMARTILSVYPEIDGVMAADMPACAFLKAALDMGRRVPEDFSVLAFDGTYLTNVNVMEITSIVQPLEAMAANAVETMTTLLEGGTPENTFIKLPVTLKQGKTA